MRFQDIWMPSTYTSAPEAYWHLAENKMHDKSHCIVRLALHLPKQQPVYFREGNHEAATESAAEKHTMLTAYFKYNAANHTQYTYSEFPKYFVFNKQNRIWTPQKQRGEDLLGISKRHGKILPGSLEGHRVLIPRIRLAPTDASLPFILKRVQFPVRLSYCMTIWHRERPLIKLPS